jgi:hypothetical protein
VTNQQIFDFESDENDMAQLDALNGTAESTGQPKPYDMRQYERTQPIYSLFSCLFLGKTYHYAVGVLIE